MGRAGNDERLDKADAKEAKKIDEGSKEGSDGEHLRECDDVERDGVADLLAPSEEQIIDDGEEESEEEGVC